MSRPRIDIDLIQIPNFAPDATPGLSNPLQMKQPGAQIQEKLTSGQRKNKYEQEADSTLDTSSATIQAKEAETANKTGLPDSLKTAIENLSGYSMDDVKVHYNSDKPARLQAHAYAQGTDIHIAPGEEKHLPHEAWHVIQQKQGRVKPTMQAKGKAINEDHVLEREADRMGQKAEDLRGHERMTIKPSGKTNEQVLQRSVAITVEDRRKSDEPSVVIWAKGKASDFSGGDAAGNRGWSGVEKYKARRKVGDNEEVECKLINNNNFKAAHSGQVLAAQNGGNGSQAENVFAQDAGPNTGGDWSSFEIAMRQELNAAPLNASVQFRGVLYGEIDDVDVLDKKGEESASEVDSDFEGFGKATKKRHLVDKRNTKAKRLKREGTDES